MLRSVNAVVTAKVSEGMKGSYLLKGNRYDVIAVISLHGRDHGFDRQFRIIDETGSVRDYPAVKFDNGIDVFDSLYVSKYK